MATAYIKEMINATTSDIVYPVTKSQAVYMEDNSTTVQKAIDDLSALKNVPALDSQTSPNVSDLLTIFRNTNSTGYKALVSDVAKTIIESYNGSSLAGSTQSVKSALDSLNSSLALAPLTRTIELDVQYGAFGDRVTGGNKAEILIGKLNDTTNYVQFFFNGIDYGYIAFDVSRNVGVKSTT